MANKQIRIHEQEQIIDSKGKNLIVSASAGSGKTSVMIRKILKYILDKECHVDELLVLTYTKSAAQEMKKKLVDKLRENVDNSPELFEELEMVQGADISTFDSFCQKLVKKYFYILDVDPSFGILEGGEQNYQQGLAMKAALALLKKDNPKIYELLLDNFAPKRDEEKIKEIVLNVYNYTTSLLDFDEFVEKNNNFYQKNEKIAENYLNFYYEGILKQIKNNLEFLKTSSDNYGFNKYVGYISNLLIAMERVLSIKRFAEKIEFCKDVDYGRLYADKADEYGFKNLIIKEKDKLKSVFDKIVEDYVSLENVDNSYNECGKLCQAIFLLLNIFVEKYTVLKEKINSYDFNDIERLTIKLLENKEICDEVKNTYKYIFVDEFQDANAVQERIIFLLEKNNLFFVGDTKQSIYAFRQSDPEIFLKIENKFSAGENGEAKTLNCNFRTHKNILFFVNKIYNTIMTDTTAGLDYENKAQFDPKAPYEDLAGEINVSLNLVEKKQKAEKEAPTRVYSVKDNCGCNVMGDSYDDECAFICQQIINLLGEKIYDKDLETVREIGYEDITILVAKRGPFLDTLCLHLNEVGIPYIVGANQNLEELYDNVVLYSLLKYSQNSKDDYSLYSIISSPLFNFSDSELAYIKEKNIETNYFYESLEKYSENDELKSKINQFYSKVKEFAFNVKYKGIYYALTKVIKESQYLLKISFEDKFQNRKLNIEEYINSFCGSKYDKNLSEYLLYRETALRGQKVQTDKKNLQAVEITTMHSSKGLEYPIVILPNLDADNFKTQTSGDIKICKEFGIGLKAYNLQERSVSNGIFYEACSLKNRLIEQSEKIRLLYVAMTRAKNKLILVGRNSCNYQKFKDDYEILKTNNFLGLIMGALPETIIEKVNNGEYFNRKLFDNESMEINNIVVEGSSITKKQVIIPPESQMANVEKLSEFIDKDLGCQRVDIALKNSVSEISFDEKSSINFAPEKLTISEHLSEKSSDMGTLYHKVIEKIKFENVNSEQDVKQFVECNFSKDEIDNISNFSYGKIYENICILKEVAQGARILKEQKFVMKVKHCDAVHGGTDDGILVQGIIDFLAIKENEIILVDYKLSGGSNNYLREKYQKQISLYELAVKKGFNLPINKYILNLNKKELISMD